MKALVLCVGMVVFVHGYFGICSDGNAGFRLGNNGQDFWLLFMRNASGSGAELYLDITSDENASGTVSIEGLSFLQDFYLDANTVLRVDIPASAMLMQADRVMPLGVRVVADNTITVVGSSQATASSGSYLGLPVHSLGRRYRVMSYYGLSGSHASQFAIVSPYDDNLITITPSYATSDGRPARQPFQIRLNRGEAYAVTAVFSPMNDLTGSLIESSLPVAAFSGSMATNIPHDICCADHLVQQLPPISSWGQTLITRPLQGRDKGDVWRFLAAHDNTTLLIDGTMAAVLQAGQFHETALDRPAMVQASHPIMAAQFSKGDTWDGAAFPGDPFMIIVPDSDQYISSSQFTTPSSAFSSNHITVIIEQEGIGALRLNGSTLDSDAFVAVPGTNYYTAAFPVDANTSYTLMSGMGVPFGIYVYGFNSSEAYGYPGGLTLSSVNRMSGPRIALMPETTTLFCRHNDTQTDITIAAEVHDDSPPLVQQVTLYYRHAGDLYYTELAMAAQPGGVWTASIPAGELAIPGIEYYVVATDGQVVNSSPEVDPEGDPYFVAIDHAPPVITHLPPDNVIRGADVSITATVDGDTDFVQTVELFYRKAGGDASYDKQTMTYMGDHVYQATVPGAFVPPSGLEYFIRATDNSGGRCQSGYADVPWLLVPEPFVLVTTAMPSEITSSEALTGGEVVADEFTEVMEKGVYYGTGDNPVESGITLVYGDGPGIFSLRLEGLEPATVYFVVAFAITGSGVVFGDIESFTTLAEIPSDTITIKDPVIPNAFRPGSALHENQLFTPRYTVRPDIYKMEVFNSWGFIIFVTTDPDAGWDGRHHGKDVQQGTYGYRISYVDHLGRQKVHYGMVTIIR